MVAPSVPAIRGIAMADGVIALTRGHCCMMVVILMGAIALTSDKLCMMVIM